MLLIMCQVPGSASTLQFAGQTISGSRVMLLTVDINASSITVNTEKIVLGNYLSIIATVYFFLTGSMLLKEIKAALEKEWIHDKLIPLT